MESIGTRLARFSPYAEDSGARPLPFGYQDEPLRPVPSFARQLWFAERTGPVIEIFTLREPR
jgi:hypothetical protein